MRIAYDCARYREGQLSTGHRTKLLFNDLVFFRIDDSAEHFVASPDWKVTATGSNVSGKNQSLIQTAARQGAGHDTVLLSNGSNLMCSTVQHHEMAKRIAFDAESIDRFAFIVSHKLRAPVANALGLVELLGSVAISEEEKKSCHEYLSTAVQQIDLEISKLNGILLEYRERIAGTGRNSA